MRRAAIWAGVVALAAVAAGSARWPVAPSRVAASLNAALGAPPRLTWSTPEAATFSALPWPSLRIVEAKLDDASAANVVSAPDAEIDLSPIELVLGRVAPTHVALFAPTITLDLDRPLSGGRLGATDAIAAIRGFAPLGSVSLTDGVVRVTSRRQGFDTVFESVRGRFDGLSLTSRFSVDLSAVWRGAPLVVSGSLDEPATGGAWKGELAQCHDRFGARRSDVRRSVDSRRDARRRRGAFGLVPCARGSGSTVWLHAVSTPCGGGRRNLWRGQGDAWRCRLRRCDGHGGRADASRRAASRAQWRPARGFGLARQRAFVAASAARRLEPFAPPDGGWSRNAFLAAPPRDFDLDLRLSAERLDVYGVGLDNVAVSAMLRDGALTASLIDATAYGGHAKGELRIACDRRRIARRGAREPRRGGLRRGRVRPRLARPDGKGRGRVRDQGRGPLSGRTDRRTFRRRVVLARGRRHLGDQSGRGVAPRPAAADRRDQGHAQRRHGL